MQPTLYFLWYKFINYQKILILIQVDSFIIYAVGLERGMCTHHAKKHILCEMCIGDQRMSKLAHKPDI